MKPNKEAAIRLLLVIFVACCVSGCLPEEKAETEEAPARPVSYVSLKRSDPSLATLVAGTVESWKKELVGFQVGGRVSFMREPGTNIQGRLFDENGVVVASGTVMASIENERYKARVSEAEATVAGVLAEAEVVRTDIEQTIPSQVREVQAEYTRAKEEFERQDELLKRGSGTRKNLEVAQAEFEAADARLAQLTSLKAEKNAQLAVIQANAQQAKEVLRQATLDLDDTKLFSPFNGQISKVHVIPGGYVERGQPVVTVQMMDPMKIQVAVSPDVDREVNFNDLVNVYVDGRDEPIQGWVWNKDTVADASTRTFMVTLLVRNRRVETKPTDKLADDSYTIVDALWNLESESGDGTSPFFINQEALHQDDEGYFVWRAQGLSIPDLDRPYDPVFKVQKVRLNPSDRQMRFLQVFTYRELADLGQLDPNRDLLTGQLPSNVKDGDTVFFSRKRWQLRPGQLVRVDLRQGRMPAGYYVPAQAVVKSGDAHHVFVVEEQSNGEEQATKVAVELGAAFGATQAISSDREGALREGLRLITEGAHFLRDGDRVNAAFEQEDLQ
ncbi:efflux RND transporter periplasmic adaptor subunit [Ruegeria sp. MALMAid1280]|uniref:efflux RND transporter periplasmic adaptor subunit n=1 Tax=Ruegeria sp. MALMAid1280 TaxID=3411634 RepID=UPI003B9FE896